MRPEPARQRQPCSEQNPQGAHRPHGWVRLNDVHVEGLHVGGQDGDGERLPGVRNRAGQATGVLASVAGGLYRCFPAAASTLGVMSWFADRHQNDGHAPDGAPGGAG